MDRAGSYAVAFSLVALSALHMFGAPDYAYALPAALMIFGIVRLWSARKATETAVESDFPAATVPES